MSGLFHEGELAVQRRVGVTELAERVGSKRTSIMPPAFQDFVSQQPMVVVASAAGDGRVWASLLTGQPGFARAVDDHTLRLAAEPSAGDPLATNLRSTGPLGLLAIDLATRRRLRLNGPARRLPDGGLEITAAEVFGNCQKYIQARELLEPNSTHTTADETLGSTRLNEVQQRQIEAADTFFIATVNRERGADVSHRGGRPGFIRVVGDRLLEFPDYAGNNMFQTLGNLELDPYAGLLFVDFDRGQTLQLSGRAQVIWDSARLAKHIGAERLVELAVEQVVEIPHAIPWRWALREYSPANPG